MLNTEDIVALACLPGITAQAVRALIDSGKAFDEIAGAPQAVLAARGLRRSAIEAIAAPEPYIERAAALAHRAARHGASIIDFRHHLYPPRLRQIYAPPIVLYVLGVLPEGDEDAVAVVGTRRATMYGRLAAESYATRFAESGVTVVSGLARGIDTFAHAAALRGGGRTIAVVASGLDEIQPQYAAEFAARISAQGAVISEYPFGVKALRPYFPQRNRIISGLSTGVVIVESDERGGAMITAGFALDQNREVFAVPGPITAAQSRGANLLVRTDRARLTQSPDDVLEALGYRVAPPPGMRPPADMGEFSVFEARLLEALGPEPIHIDALCETAGMSTSEALVNLLSLEFKGLVRQMAGKMFVRG